MNLNLQQFKNFRLNKNSAFKELGMFICFSGIGLFISGILFLVALKLFNINIEIFNDRTLIKSNIIIWIFNIINSLIFLIPVFLFNFYFKKPWSQFVINKKAYSMPNLILVCIITVLIVLFGQYFQFPYKKIFSPDSMQYFQHLEDEYNNTVIKMIKFDSLLNTISTFFMFAIVPAIVEELYFRGVLQDSLIKLFRPIFGIILTAAIFSAIHFSVLGFVERLIAGLILGFVYFYSKNIILSMLIHFLNNTLVLLPLYFLKNDLVKIKEKMSESITPNYFLSIIIVVSMIIVFKYFKKINYETHKFQN